MKKQPEVTRQTRENLKKAFWKLYGKKGIEKIAVKEVTDLAGYNRGTFYLYYKDIYQLLDEAEEELLEQMKEAAEEGKKAEAEEMLEQIIANYEKHKKYLDILLGPHGDPSFFEKLKQEMKEAGRREMERNGYMDREIQELFLEYHVSGAVALARYCRSVKRPVPLEDIVQLIRCFDDFYRIIKREQKGVEMSDQKNDSTNEKNC